MSDAHVHSGSGPMPDPSPLELEQLLSIGAACDLARSLLDSDPSHMTSTERAALRGHISGCSACRDYYHQAE